MINQIAAKKGKKRPVKIRPVKSQKGIEADYRKELNRLAKALEIEIRQNVMPLLKNRKEEYTSDGVVDDVIRALSAAKAKFASIAMRYLPVASRFVNRVSQNNQKRIASGAENAVGVNMEHVLQTPELNGLLEAETQKNIALIKSIPDEFFKDIEVTIMNGITEGKRWETIAKEIAGTKGITSTFGKLKNRVKLIARNEASNINATLNKRRQEALGIELYEWSGSLDERERKNHRAMESKICKWSDPTVYADSIEAATTGKWKKRSSIGGVELHPGHDYNCRCAAIGVINPEEA